VGKTQHKLGATNSEILGGGIGKKTGYRGAVRTDSFAWPEYRRVQLTSVSAGPRIVDGVSQRAAVQRCVCVFWCAPRCVCVLFDPQKGNRGAAVSRKPSSSSYVYVFLLLFCCESTSSRVLLHFGHRFLCYQSMHFFLLFFLFVLGSIYVRYEIGMK